ncbi:MAG TPA: hypothetical protein VM598_11870 [Bdellovibrionota bacterium]|nr:hypothetical protein [Bdellovibrionota bacterium]
MRTGISQAAWAACAFLASVIISMNASAGELKVGKRAKVYLGPEGEKVTIVPLEPVKSGDFLIKFEGVEGEWDDQVFRHHRNGSGSREDYKLDGQNYVSVTQRDGSMTAYPKGVSKDLSIYYSKKDSEKVQPKAILAEFQKQDKSRPKAAEGADE